MKAPEATQPQAKDAMESPVAGHRTVSPTELPSIHAIPNTLREQPDFSVPAALAAELDEIITHYPKKRSASLMLLHAMQGRFGHVSRQAVEWIAAKLELQPINIYELVTFYPMFQRNPVGKYHLRVCRTLSCALGGSYELHHHFCDKLGLDPHAHGPQTTADGKFTVEFVECLASCGTAPVMMCNESFYEGVSTQEADKIMGECK
ncbi:MAG TPA: NADH-quinone oxidoreductase subunit NuoE [Verrucomicrobiae bacterium]|nr:NADH-quinone oxidoreductase subunit NuoE [Verrucomicrobiae bacterium]